MFAALDDVERPQIQPETLAARRSASPVLRLPASVYSRPGGATGRTSTPGNGCDASAPNPASVTRCPRAGQRPRQLVVAVLDPAHRLRIEAVVEQEDTQRRHPSSLAIRRRNAIRQASPSRHCTPRPTTWWTRLKASTSAARPSAVAATDQGLKKRTCSRLGRPQPAGRDRQRRDQEDDRVERQAVQRRHRDPPDQERHPVQHREQHHVGEARHRGTDVPADARLEQGGERAVPGEPARPRRDDRQVDGDPGRHPGDP